MRFHILAIHTLIVTSETKASMKIMPMQRKKEISQSLHQTVTFLLLDFLFTFSKPKSSHRNINSRYSCKETPSMAG